MNGPGLLRALGLTACALGLAACLTVGRPFRSDLIGQLEIGKTTRDEVHRMFGEPWREGVEDGRRTVTYGYYKYRLVGTTETQDLVIRFDPKSGTVASYTFNAAPPLGTQR